MVSKYISFAIALLIVFWRDSMLRHCFPCLFASQLSDANKKLWWFYYCCWYLRSSRSTKGRTGGFALLILNKIYLCNRPLLWFISVSCVVSLSLVIWVKFIIYDVVLWHRIIFGRFVWSILLFYCMDKFGCWISLTSGIKPSN